MDLVASCKDKLAYFRIKELKDVLTQLGLSKQGKKQDLVDRILAILSDERVSGIWAKKNAVGKEEVAKLVDDTYRKMQVSGAADLASKSQPVSDSTSIKAKEETEDSYQVEKIRCICGSTLATDSMIKCEDPRCNVWQHIACVLIPEKPMEGGLPNPPDIFFCELCRLSRADPFWVTVAHPLYPVKLNITNVPTDGSNPSQSIEKTFQLTRADRDLLSKPEYDVQAWCMLLNDKVTFRMQWPQYADLQVNGVPVRAINRPGSQLLGANGRDDGPVITPCTRDGINKIFIGGCDARIFCVGVRIVKRRTLNQVLNLIPKEADGEPFEDALARVRRCVGGGAATENADSDSDIEVVADCIPVNLRCPMSGLRMKVAGRFKNCVHMGCFDLEVFVEMNQRSRKWQCPICLKNYALEKIIIDPYFNRVTSKMRNCGEDVAEIEVKPDGSWRAKAEGDRRGLGELGLWHLPDGTISPSTEAESKPKPNPELRPVKQEVGSDSHAGLKLGIRKNRNGCWEFNKPDDMHQGISSANRFATEKIENNIIPMSSSATGSGRDCEDASVNQSGENANLDFSTVNGAEYESGSMNIDPTHGFNDRTTSAPPGDAEVIVLTDSDDDIEPLLSSGAAVYKNSEPETSGVPFPATQHGIPDPYYENPGLGLYGTNDDDFGINMWSLPSGSQGGPGFQLFGSDVDVSDPLVEMQHPSLNCSSSINGYTLTAETAMGSAALVPDTTTGQHSNSNNNSTNDHGLVDNPLAFSGNDPSLQIFLPTRPSDASTMQSDLRENPDVSNGVRTEDWISLRLGQGESTTAANANGGLSSGQRLQSKDGALDTLADNALLLGVNDNRSGKASRERSDSPFSFPRQLKVYVDRMSQPSRAILIFCKANGLEFEEVKIELAKGQHRSPEFAEVNPMKQVPALVHGDFKLFESHAILIYLASAFPGVADHWYPADVQERAQVHSVLDWHHSNLRHGSVGYIFNSAIALALGLPLDLKAAAEGEKLLSKSLATIESFWLKGDAPFLLGNSKPSIADLALVCEIMQMEVADENERDRILGPHKRILKWIEDTKNVTAPYFDEIHAIMPPVKEKLKELKAQPNKQS